MVSLGAEVKGELQLSRAFHCSNEFALILLVGNPPPPSSRLPDCSLSAKDKASIRRVIVHVTKNNTCPKVEVMISLIAGLKQ